MLAEKEYRDESKQAYMSVWDEAGAAQPGGVPLQLSEPPKCVALDPPALDPQLVIWDFKVTAHGHAGKVGRLVQGQLHIRTPSGQKAPSPQTKTQRGKHSECWGRRLTVALFSPLFAF